MLNNSNLTFANDFHFESDETDIYNLVIYANVFNLTDKKCWKNRNIKANRVVCNAKHFKAHTR